MFINNENLLSLSIKENGYTLLQMAMALMVIGILFAGFLGIYTQYQTQEKVTKTADRITNAVQSVQKYRNVFGTLPCPAPMNISRGAASTVDPEDNEYGYASNYARFLPAGAVPLAAGQCAEGICVEQNTRTDLTAPNNVLRVRVGAIPFRNMQLDESDTYDAYGSRLWYAVTEDMCNLTTYNETMGAINIVNDQGETQTTPANSAAFVIISAGVNKIGGYGLDGALQVPCGGSLDSENCRDVTVVGPTAATYRTQFVQDATLANSFDDIVEFFSSAQTQLWRRTAPGAEDILDLANQSIGIGIGAPAATLDIAQSAVSTLPIPPAPPLPATIDFSIPYLGDVATTNETVPNREHGALRVGSGFQLRANAYCNETGTNCFKPEDFGVGGTGIAPCSAGTYPTGITSDIPSKEAVFRCATISTNCPVGQVFTGFTNNAGNLQPNCIDPTLQFCPARTFSICGANDLTLPASAPTTGWSNSTRGDCRTVWHMCTGGQWELAWFSQGPERCNNAPVTRTLQCNAGALPGPTCWAGTYSLTSLACTGAVTNNTRASDCLCQNCNIDVTPLCPSPQTGNLGTTRSTYVCNPAPGPNATHDLVSQTQLTPSNCSCGRTPYNQFYDCQAGYIRNSAAPPLTPNNWPGDVNKGKYQLVNVDSSCNYVSGAITDHCTCDTTTRYTAAEPSPPTCKQPKTGSRPVPSSGGSSYDWKYSVSEVTIEPTNCQVASTNLLSPAEFEDIQLYWREKPNTLGSPVPSRPGGTPEIGESCSCSTYGVGGGDVNCVKPNLGGGFDTFRCRCDR